jgi:hypothetical protein
MSLTANGKNGSKRDSGRNGEQITYFIYSATLTIASDQNPIKFDGMSRN